MSSSCLSLFYLGATFFYALPLIRIFPAFVRLLFALATGQAKWPGTIVPNPNPRASVGRARVGLSPDHLFPIFLSYTLGLIGAFVFSALTFLSTTSIMAGYVHFDWSIMTWLLTFGVFWGGWLGLTRATNCLPQVTALLSNLDSNAEPRQSDTSSAEVEYAIEHPLANHKTTPPEVGRAVQVFCEATTFYQCGDQRSGLMLYQEALSLDPNLHQHAREALSQLALSSSPQAVGSVDYWLGIHSEYMMDWSQAKTWYEKAADAFHQQGYTHRESRAHCNLGNVKMHLHDATGMEEFEQAIALNPKNGTAHLNIGRLYYRISDEGDPRFDRALDAFADAIVADPQLYGPQVIASLREIGYTWKEDLEKVTQRVESKRR